MPQAVEDLEAIREFIREIPNDTLTSSWNAWSRRRS